MNNKPDVKPLKREEFITKISTSTKGAKVIEQLKELEDARGPEGINQLKERILEACFLAAYYQRDKDHYEIARHIDQEFLKIESLLELLKKHPSEEQIKALRFTQLLSDKGICMRVDDTKIKPDRVQMLEVIIESLRDSTCLNTGNPRSVIGSMDYGHDLINTNQKPDVGKMGLIYNLVIIIEYWKNAEFVRLGDKLMRQLNDGKTRFLHYDIVTSFVNETFDVDYKEEAIKNKLKQHLKNNPNICYSAHLILD